MKRGENFRKLASKVSLFLSLVFGKSVLFITVPTGTDVIH